MLVRRTSSCSILRRYSSPPSPLRLPTLARSTLQRIFRLVCCAFSDASTSSPHNVHDPSGSSAVIVPLATVSVEPLRLPLAIEIIERISDFLFELKPPTLDSKGNAPIHCTKPLWSHVKGFMYASAELHRMGYIRWLRVITVKFPDDWSIISQNLQFIREVRCLDNTLNIKNQHILSKLPSLYSLTIDAHSDVWHDGRNRFTYRDTVPALPPSLKRLEITNAHGPDIRVIDTVKKDCPQIEELRLGRCTMFNRIPACDFWVSFPHDHDAYISNAGVDAYAHSLGHELSSLKKLRSLRMGLYFAPSDIVLAHRLYHQRGLQAPETIDWQTAIPISELPTNPFIQEAQLDVDPATTEQLVSVLHRLDPEPNGVFDCARCTETTAEDSKNAEMEANTILREHVPSLMNVQWMGWLTSGHLGMDSYELPSLDL